MQEWQQRVVEEKKELDEKISKLREFIESSQVFINLTLPERQLLLQQLGIMERYSDILTERIGGFE